MHSMAPLSSQWTLKKISLKRAAVQRKCHPDFKIISVSLPLIKRPNICFLQSSEHVLFCTVQEWKGPNNICAH